MKRTTKRLLALTLCLLLLPLDGLASAMPDRAPKPPRYMRELSRLVASAQTEDAFGEIELTLGEPEMTVDGETQDIPAEPYMDEDGEVRIPTAVIGEPEALEGTFLTKDELEKEGYVVDVDDGNVCIADVYGLCRLVVKTTGGKPMRTDGVIGSVAMPGDRYVLQYADRVLTMRAAEALKAQEDVLACVPDQLVTIDADEETSDAPIAWGTYYSGADVFRRTFSDASQLPQITVAVVDTGVDLTHPFLQGRIADGGWDFVNDDDDPQDDHFHGTHCAGIVRDATPDNVKILPIKSLNAQGTGSGLIFCAGIVYACESGADIVSMSFGGTSPRCNDDLYDVMMLIYQEGVDSATEHGVTLFAAAGNNSADASCTFPAAIREVISVASVDEFGQHSSFSNYGDAIDIAAPGENVLSSVPGGGFESYSGTSMACPLAAACGALLLCEDNTRTPEDVRALLRSRARDAGAPGVDPYYGAGIVYLGQPQALTDLRFMTHTITLRPYEHRSLPMYVAPYNAQDTAFTLESTDPSVVEVEQNGTIRAHNVLGTVQITLRSAVDDKSDICTVTVRGGSQIRSIMSVYTPPKAGNSGGMGLLALKNDGTAMVMGGSFTKIFGYYNFTRSLSWFDLRTDPDSVISCIRSLWANNDVTLFTDQTNTLCAVGEIDGEDSSEIRRFSMPDGEPLTDIVSCVGQYALRADGTVWLICSTEAQPVRLEDETPLTHIRAIHRYTAIAESGEAYKLCKKQISSKNYTEPYYAELLIAEGIDPADVVDCVCVVPGTLGVSKNPTAFWLLRDGTLWVKGEANKSTILGDPRIDEAVTPHQVPKQISRPLTGVTQIREHYSTANGSASMYALCNDGTVWAWGYSDSQRDIYSPDPYLGPIGVGKKTSKEYGYPLRVRTDDETYLTGVTYLPEAAGGRMLFELEDGTVYWAGLTNIQSVPAGNSENANYDYSLYAAPAVIDGQIVMVTPDAPSVDPALTSKNIESINISDEAVRMHPDDTLALTAQTAPADADDAAIVWKSSAPWIASVTPEGVVTAHNPGNVTITVESYYNDRVNAVCEVTVLPQTEPVPGDVNGDGALTLKDVTLIIRYLAGGWNVTIDADSADVNGDGTVDLPTAPTSTATVRSTCAM